MCRMATRQVRRGPCPNGDRKTTVETRSFPEHQRVISHHSAQALKGKKHPLTRKRHFISAGGDVHSKPHPERNMLKRLLPLGVLLFAPFRIAETQEARGVEYAVKAICGIPDRPALANGTYFTAINVHNPGSQTIRFRQKVAVTLPGEQPGSISPFWESALRPDQALEIDCTDIMRRAQVRTRFIKGFVVIQSPSDLDVVAVYTAAPSERGTVAALEIERVPGRRVGISGGCELPDLVVDTILRPTFVNGGSRIEAVIRNLGPGAAAASLARVIDPTTLQPGGAPYNAIAPTPPLAAGATATVVFTLPYWVFNPDAVLDVTADYKGDVAECREDNNSKHYEARG